MRPGRSGAFFFCPPTPKKFGRAARRVSPQSGRLFPQIDGQSKGTTTDKRKAYSSYVPFGRRRTPDAITAISGKSMIEMLAVLAIMGILTVGGIAAYSFAVAKHRANQIYNQVDLRAVTAFSNPIVRQTQIGNTFFLPGFDDTFENLPYEHSKIGNAAFQIKVTNVPQKVCRRLQDMTFKLPRQVTLNGEDVSSACGAQNTFVFVYDGLPVGKPSSGVTPIDCDCSGCQSCESGTCQDNDNLCGPKEVCVSGRCQCAPDYTECRGGCYTACGDGLMRDPISCDCVCEPQACPDFANWDETSCSCQCEDGYEMCGGTCHPVCDGSGMTGSRDPETCNCLCLEGTDGNTCKCPDGYIYINGQCQKFECIGGTTGATFSCYINGSLCGLQCLSDGYSCFYGTCRPDDCPTGTTFVEKNVWHVYGGCVDGEKQCSNYGSNWICSSDELDGCCDASPFGECYFGTCYDKTICDAYGATYGLVRDRFGGCIFSNGIRCLPFKDKWNCYIGASSMPCGTECADPTNCGTCQEEYCYLSAPGKCLVCRDGTTPIKESDGYYHCDTSLNELICDIEDSASSCYIDGKRCGSNCFNITTAYCGFGLCKDPGCPEGFTFSYISASDNYGCVNETTGIACSYNANYAGASCLYNGKMCAIGCQGYDATDCKTIYLEQCSQDGNCPYGQKITETCTCPTNPDGAVGTYCCAPGHITLATGCNQITCPDGEEADENGICQPI